MLVATISLGRTRKTSKWSHQGLLWSTPSANSMTDTAESGARTSRLSELVEKTSTRLLQREHQQLIPQSRARPLILLSSLPRSRARPRSSFQQVLRLQRMALLRSPILVYLAHRSPRKLSLQNRRRRRRPRPMLN